MTAHTFEMRCPRCGSAKVRAVGPGIPSPRSEWLVTDCFDCHWPEPDTRLQVDTP